MLEREGIGLHFVLADYEDVSCAHLVGGLERFLQSKRLVAEIDHQIVAPEFPCQAGSFAIHSGAERSNINVGLTDDRLRRRGKRKHQTIFSNGKANSRSGRAAEGLR